MDGQMGGCMGGWVGKMDRWAGRHIHHVLRFEFLTVATMKMAAFWNLAPCGLLDADQCLIITLMTKAIRCFEMLKY
jgi:hypothetical protein